MVLLILQGDFVKMKMMMVMMELPLTTRMLGVNGTKIMTGIATPGGIPQLNGGTGSRGLKTVLNISHHLLESMMSLWQPQMKLTSSCRTLWWLGCSCSVPAWTAQNVVPSLPFTTSRVKEALRLNWPEEDLRKRDQAKGSALLVDEDFDDALLHEEEEVDLESLDDESREEYGYLIKNVESAFQAFQGARRTLKEAREKQSMFRKSRQFFPMRKESVTKVKSESKVKCFKCGGQHHTSECPDKHAPFTISPPGFFGLWYL